MKSVIATLVRRAMVVVGTWLCSRGLITEGDWQTIVTGNIDVLVGVVVMIASVVWSIFKNKRLEKAAK
jgi:ribose/xylose/arabinose/galactoside ABC-type transport system permease subunit